ncbi:MAG: right-handed parallel beta-helix repeat-containing protein [Bacteroidales bacterium]
MQATSGTIQDNQFLNTSIGIQYMPYGHTTSALIQRNTITAGSRGLYHNYQNKGAAQVTWSQNEVSVAPNDRAGLKAQVYGAWTQQLTFRGMEAITFGTQGSGAAPQVYFNNNKVDGNIASSPYYTSTIGYRTYDASATGITTLTDNSFTNLNMGVVNNSSVSVAATCNWWGTTVPAEIAAKITGSATYIPYSVSDGGACAGGMPVQVTRAGTVISGHATIQAAIDAASTGDVINVAEGTYYEEVLISGKTNLTLTGAGEGLTVVAPVRAFALNNNGISLYNSNNITIQNLTVDGFANAGLAAGVAHFKDGIHFGNNASPESNVGGNNCIFTHVTVQNVDRRGISIFPETLTNNQITYCTINNVTGVNNGQGYGQGVQFSGSGLIEHCNISNVTGALLGNCNVVGGTLSIQDNVITDLTGLTGTPFDIGINFWCKQSNVITVKNNSITANVADNTGIYVVRGGDGSEISYNTINLTGNGGLGIETGWENTWGFPIHHNTITMGKGGAGIVITGAGSDADPMLIYNNTLTNVGSDDLFTNDYTGYSEREVGLLLSGHKYTSRTGDANYSFNGSVYNNTINGFKDGIVLASQVYASGGFKDIDIKLSDKNSITNYETAARYGYISNTSPYPFTEIASTDANYTQQDLSMNYWGSATPDFSTIIDGKIKYCLYYKDAGFTIFPVKNINTGIGYCTIQAAINAATAGDVINVAAGTYTEAGQIVINKNLTITGADKATTIIKPAQGTGGSGYMEDNTSWILVNSGVTFNLSNVTLDGSGQIIVNAILSHGHGTIDNNIIKNMQRLSSYDGVGVALLGSDMTVSNNTFSGIGREGVWAVFFSNATITGNTYTGKGSGDWLDYAVEVGRNSTATISGNTFTACIGVASYDGSTSAGIMVTSYYDVTGTHTNATITGNTITGNFQGITVGYDANDVSVVTATNNDFSGNTGAAIITTVSPVSATCNWFGTADADVISGKISGLVNWSPFLTTSDLVTPSCNGTTPVRNITRSTYHGTIQGAINATTTIAGDVIEVAAGTYNENVDITKSVELRGANYGTSGCNTRVAESVIQGSFTIGTDNITVDGFEFTGANAQIASTSGATVRSNITIKDNYLHATTAQIPIRHGLGLGGGIGSENWIVSNNKIEDIQYAQASAIAVFNVTNATINNNCITHTNATYAGRRGINADGLQTATINGNTIDLGGDPTTNVPAPWLIQVSMSDRDAQNITINGNTISNAYFGITTLSQRNVTGLTITNNAIGPVSLGVTLNAGSASPVFAQPLQSNINIENNSITTVTPTISGAIGAAVRLRNLHETHANGPVGFNSVYVNSNSFYFPNSDAGVINNNATYNLNATNNYWGGCPSVSGLVEYYPFYTTVTGTVYGGSIGNITLTASTNPICSGMSTGIFAANGSAYTWNNSLPALNGHVVSPAITTTYVVNGKDAYSCATSASLVVTVNAGLSVAITPSGNTLTASGATTYVWNTGATTASITVNPSVSTVYNVVGTTGDCSGTAYYTAAVANAGSNQFICAGSSTGLNVSLGSVSMTSWSWTSLPTGFTSSIQNPTVNPTVTTTYNVLVNGLYSSSVTVFVKPTPTAIAGSNITITGSGTLSGSATGGTTPYTYAWSGPSFTSALQNPSVTAEGVYSLVVTGSNGCASINTATTTVTVETAPTYPVSGNVSYYNTLNPQMHNVTITLKQSNVTKYTAITPATGNGDYSFTGVLPGTYDVFFSLPTAWGGVTTLDVVAIQNHYKVSNPVPLIGLKRLAADVDVNTTAATINLADRNKINDKRVNSSVVFATGDWVFVKAGAEATSPATYVYANSAGKSNIQITVGSLPLTQNFKSLCYGDVNADYSGNKDLEENIELDVTTADGLQFGSYPNPFNGQTTLDYVLPVNGDVDITIFNMIGEQVAQFTKPQQIQNRYEFTWDASSMSSGVYHAVLQVRTTDNVLRKQIKMIISK